MRKTKQTEAILEVIQKAKGPLSAYAIEEQVRDQGVGIATVYRVLKKKTLDGILKEVAFANGPKRYQLANIEGKEKHHHGDEDCDHHFICDECDEAIDLDGCPGDIKKLLPRGFKMARHELNIYGTCKDCKD